MAVDHEALIREVAVRHKTLLSADDPVLVTVTLNELILNEYLRILQETNERLFERFEEARQQQSLHLETTARGLEEKAASLAQEVQRRVQSVTEDRVHELLQLIDERVMHIENHFEAARKRERHFTVLVTVVLLMAAGAAVAVFI